jgi:hypothetical protein
MMAVGVFFGTVCVDGEAVTARPRISKSAVASGGSFKESALEIDDRVRPELMFRDDLLDPR